MTGRVVLRILKNRSSVASMCLIGAILAVLAILTVGSPRPILAQSNDTPTIQVEELVTGLSIPWDLTFTPDETMLFTQRSGVLSARLTDGTVQTITADMSDFQASGEGGLMAILVDKNFSSNRRFYTCQTHSSPREVQVIAWTINSDYTEATRVADPLVGEIPGGGRHSGCRLRFGPDGYLWIATGDSAVGTHPQDLTSLGGKVLRVNASTGAGAPGNPFSAPNSSLIYSFGHRNLQGLALRPGTRQMWTVEHGPSRDDEVNLIESGGNYGWDPVPSYNESVPMTDLTKYPSAVAAKWSSGSPTLATSGGIFLEGSHWGDWEGRLAVAALKARELNVLEFDEGGSLQSNLSVSELNGTYGRLRTPLMGSDCALYVTTSNSGGNDKILRVSAGNGPVFASDLTPVRSVAENTSPGRNIGLPVVATCGGGATLTYSLSGPDADAFTIVGSAGQLRTKVSLDRDTKSRYTVVISVHDGADSNGNMDTTNDDSITVTIHVTQELQQGNGGGGGFGPAPVAPKFDEGFRAEREAYENAVAGDPVGEPVEATHQDDLAITYSLSGTDASQFTVDEHTGQIRIREGTVLTLGNTFTVNLTATDSAGFGAIIIVNIVVTEAPHHPYDKNQNGKIDRDEVITAVKDYFAGDLEKAEVLELVKRYFAEE